LICEVNHGPDTSTRERDLKQLNMELTQSFWDEVVEIDKQLRSRGKTLTKSKILERFDVSDTSARCISYALKHRDIIIPQPRPVQQDGKKIKKRVFMGGDTHCGHMAGLTPSPFHLQLDHPKFDKFAIFQRETWAWFENAIRKLQPFDIAVWNGDMIDGKGTRSGGSELLTPDRTVQVEMATDIVNFVGAKKVVMTYGTPYHAGQEEDFEGLIATATGAVAIKDELNIDIEGVVFNVKHQTGSSSVPYSTATAPLKDQLYQALWAEFEERESADIVVRSHIHEYIQINNRRGSVIVLPALQGAMTKFGGRRCVKLVDYGFAYVDIFTDGSYEIVPVRFKPESQKSKVLVL